MFAVSLGESMRCVAIAATVLLLSIALDADSSSMWCESPHADPDSWAAEALKEGDTVFLGRVYSSTPVQPSPAAPSETAKPSSMQELLELVEERSGPDPDNFDHIVWFEVVKSWKAPDRPVVKVRAYLGDFEELRSFVKGEIYLVVARDVDGTEYWIKERCNEAIHSTYSERFEEALDRSTLVK